MRPIRWRSASVFFIPFVGLCLWLGFLASQMWMATDMEVAIKGYDPRDLLSGHYVRFTLDLGRSLECKSTDGAATCVCFNNSTTIANPYWSGSCTTRPQDCTLFIKGTCEVEGFAAGIERFYIPEEDSIYLDVLPPQSTIILSVTSGGKALGKRLKPGGTDYDKWIYQQHNLDRHQSMPPTSVP